MNLILFDPGEIKTSLLPLTFTRPVAGLRVGVFTIAEKWEKTHKLKPSFWTDPYLRIKYPLVAQAENLGVNGSICPDPELVKALSGLAMGEVLKHDEEVLGFKCGKGELENCLEGDLGGLTPRSYDTPVVQIKHVWDIYLENGKQIDVDFEYLTSNYSSEPVNDPHTIVYNPENIFIEPGLKIRAAVLNAEDGPIYLGKDSVVHEGALVVGPVSLGERSHISLGSKIRGNVSIGPFSKVGGELINSVIQGYSNKAHDGFLGNSVVGEWCNIGADSNSSNLKNNYSNVKLWSYKTESFQDSGMQFLGLFMGDHSKCGINTMFNTGTIVGVGANLFGSGFLRAFVPSFSWGGAHGYSTFRLEKFIDVAEKVMERRSKVLDEDDRAILKLLYQEAVKFRVWEKN